jgi:hypothetical protein
MRAIKANDMCQRGSGTGCAQEQEQNLNQSKAAFKGVLTNRPERRSCVDQQASAICEHSMLMAEQTLSNAFDFAHKLVRMKEPQEFA